MFSLGDIGEQLKDVGRKSVGVSFAGRTLVLNTASDGKSLEISTIYPLVREAHKVIKQ